MVKFLPLLLTLWTNEGQLVRLDLHGDALPKGALCRLGTVRLAASGDISCIAFSADGKTIASTGRDGLVRLWEVATGKELRRFVGHKGSVRSVVASPNSEIIASSGYDQTIRVWEWTTGKELYNLGHDQEAGVKTSSFSPDGRVLAWGSTGGGPIRLWNTSDGKELPRRGGDQRRVEFITFSPDGKLIAIAGYGPNDEQVWLWEVASGKIILRFTTGKHSVNSLAFSPDGRLLVAGLDDRSVRLWKVSSGQQVSRWDHEAGVWSVAFSPDGERVAAAGREFVCLWNAKTNKQLQSWKVGGPVAFSPDGKALACGTWRIHLWDVKTGKEKLFVPAHDGLVYRATFSPNSRSVFTAGRDGTIRFWDSATGKHLECLIRHDHAIPYLFLLPDGGTLIWGSDDGSLRVWNVGTAQEVYRLNSGDTGLHYAGLSRDGRLLAWGAGSTVRLVDLVMKKELDKQFIHSVEDLGRRRYRQGVRCVAISSDGTTIASSASDGSISLWDFRKPGRAVRRLRAHPGHGIDCLAFSPNGTTLVSGSWNGDIAVWEVPTATEKKRFRAHAGAVKCIAFSPDGRWLASGGYDGIVQFSDVASGKELWRLTGHQGPILDVSFSADGKRLVSTSTDSTGLIWDMSVLAKELR